MHEINGEYLSDERMNLNIQLPRSIIIIADLGLLNGRFSAYKMIGSGNIRDCLYSIATTTSGMWTGLVICAAPPSITTGEITAC
ncbi:MAG: hypothetical protein AB7D36_07465, partial [Oscillospiraceae bacterium]